MKGRGAGAAAGPLHRSDPFGRAALAALVVCAGSGAILAALWRPESPRASVSAITYGWPFGYLLRNLHWVSATALVGLTVAHLAWVLWKGLDRRWRPWARVSGVGLLVLLPLLYVTGFILRGDVEAGAARAVLEGLLLRVPLLGGPLAALIVGGPAPSMAVVGVQHAGLLTLLALGASLHHGRLWWPDRRTLTLTLAFGLALSAVIVLPVGVPEGGNAGQRVLGPWPLWGVQAALSFVAPGVVLGTMAAALLALGLRPELGPRGARLVGWGFAVAGIVDLGLGLWLRFRGHP